jgi:hypothetical protein
MPLLIQLNKEPHHFFNFYPYADIYAGMDMGSGRYQIKYGPPCTFAAETIFPLGKVIAITFTLLTSLGKNIRP